MKQLIFLLLFLFLRITSSFCQTFNDSIYNKLWENKRGSIFDSVSQGEFFGTTSGFVMIVSKKDSVLIELHDTKATLAINEIEDEVYDDNTKMYSTKSADSATLIRYETFMLANILSISFRGIEYSIGGFDGAADMPLNGITFQYSHEKNTEYLTLFVSKPLLLTSSQYLYNQGNITMREARKNEKVITILPGTALVWVITK